MSTHIKTLKGIKELGLSGKKTETTIEIRRFWGGKERMIQLTIGNFEGFIQLTEEKTLELAKTLLNSFDNTIYPSE